MPGPATTPNVIAAICSFFIAGLGQLVQGRILAALIHCVLAAIVWVVSLGMLGWIVHLYSCYDAAVYRKR